MHKIRREKTESANKKTKQRCSTMTEEYSPTLTIDVWCFLLWFCGLFEVRNLHHYATKGHIYSLQYCTAQCSSYEFVQETDDSFSHYSYFMFPGWE